MFSEQTLNPEPTELTELTEETLDAVSAGDDSKLLGAILSAVSKARAEISMTIARNARA